MVLCSYRELSFKQASEYRPLLGSIFQRSCHMAQYTGDLILLTRMTDRCFLLLHKFPSVLSTLCWSLVAVGWRQRSSSHTVTKENQCYWADVSQGNVQEAVKRPIEYLSCQNHGISLNHYKPRERWSQSPFPGMKWRITIHINGDSTRNGSLWPFSKSSPTYTGKHQVSDSLYNPGYCFIHCDEIRWVVASVRQK